MREEVVALPNSRSLVLPLAEGSFLAGMLVVDVQAERPGLGGGGGGGGQPAVPGTLHAGGRGAAPACAAGGEPGARQLVSQLNPSLPLTDDQLNCLRLVAPALAKACAMEQAAALAALQQTARQQVAQSLLRQAKGPLTALQTFSHMLVPRLPEGAPDRDMAQGILLQGSRLGEVVKQLEVALHPHTLMSVANVPPARELQELASSSSASADSGDGGSSDGGASASSSARSSAFDGGFGAGQWPLQGGAAQQAGAGAGDAPGSSTVGGSPSSAVEAVWMAHSSGSDTDDPAAHTIDIGPGDGSGARGQRLPQWPPLQQQQEDQQQQQEKQQAGGLDLLDERRGSHAAAGPWGAHPGAAGAGSSGPSAATGECDVVDSLTHVLTAASKLAKVSGILFVVNYPLRMAPGSSGSISISSGGASSGDRPFKGLPVDLQLGRPQLRRPVRPAAQQQQGPAPGTATTVEVVVQSSSTGAGGGAGSTPGKLLRPVWQGPGMAAAAMSAPEAAQQLQAQQQPRPSEAPHMPVDTLVEATAIEPPVLDRAAGGSSTSSSSEGGEQQEQQEQQEQPQPQQQPQQQGGPWLRVSVHPALVQRIVGYVVDIALQCTPPGGQVCVTARHDGGGVEVRGCWPSPPGCAAPRPRLRVLALRACGSSEPECTSVC